MALHPVRGSSPPCLLFVHVPKTAGMSFKRILSRQFLPAEVWDVPYAIGEFQKAVDAYRKLGEAERGRFKCVMGHMPFGIHEWVPGPYEYITFLRDPVERFLSFYSFAKAVPSLRQELGVPSAALRSAENFLEHEREAGLNNLQVRMLSGFDRCLDKILPPYGPMGEEALSLALSNLESHFGFVGFTDEFDVGLLQLRRRYGWRHIYYARKNVTKVRATQAEVPPEVLRRIEEDNWMDRRLVQHARERSRKAEADAELKRFRKLNRVYGLGRDAYVAGPLRLLQATRRLFATAR